MCRDLINRLILNLPEALLLTSTTQQNESTVSTNQDIHAKSTMRFIGAVTEYGLIDPQQTIKIILEILAFASREKVGSQDLIMESLLLCLQLCVRINYTAYLFNKYLGK